MNKNISFGEALGFWLKLGFISFGGPAGQIAIMHRVLVDERKWIEEERFLHALNFCVLLPGPEAQKLATYAGWLLHGTRGALAAGILFVLPGAIVAVVLWLGPNHVLADIGLFFSKLAVVSFGGAYALLAYMAQQAVESYHWMSAPEMVDGLGLAETTPGPLILVTQFVGFLAGYRDPAPFAPLGAGIAAAALTTWVTFVPPIVLIFAGAAFVEQLRSNQRLYGALAAITAALVGV